MTLNGRPVSWKAVHQTLTALSTTDADIEAVIKFFREMKGQKTQIFSLVLDQMTPTFLTEGDAAATFFSMNAFLRENIEHLIHGKVFLKGRRAKERREASINTCIISS